MADPLSWSGVNSACLQGIRRRYNCDCCPIDTPERAACGEAVCLERTCRSVRARLLRRPSLPSKWSFRDANFCGYTVLLKQQFDPALLIPKRMPVAVMAGLVPAIHVFEPKQKTWMPGIKPGMTGKSHPPPHRIRHGRAAQSQRLRTPNRRVPRRLMLDLGVDLGAEQHDHREYPEPQHRRDHRAQ
jgi:hypothetical protein